MTALPKKPEPQRQLCVRWDAAQMARIRAIHASIPEAERPSLAALVRHLVDLGLEAVDAQQAPEAGP